jgi:hypothetical protein
MDLKEEQVLLAPPTPRRRRNSLLADAGDYNEDWEPIQYSFKVKEKTRTASLLAKGKSRAVLIGDLHSDDESLFTLADNLRDKCFIFEENPGSSIDWDSENSFLSGSLSSPPKIPTKLSAISRCRRTSLQDKSSTSKTLSKTPSRLPRGPNLLTTSAQSETFPMIPLKQKSTSAIRLRAKKSTNSEETMRERTARWSEADSLVEVPGPQSSTLTNLGSYPTMIHEQAEGGHEEQVEETSKFRAQVSHFASLQRIRNEQKWLALALSQQRE